MTETNEKHSFRVAGTPLWDPVTKSPFALAYHKEEIRRLPAVRKGATVITSSVAAPLLSAIFAELGDLVNVVAVDKDIGCLITIRDLLTLDLADVKETVILPGRTMAFDPEMRKVLSRDGVARLVRRGPDRLTVDGEMSISMTPEEVIEAEVEAFTELIEEINGLGV